MKVILVSLLLSSVAAFAPASTNSRTSSTTAVKASQLDELKAIAEKSNPVLKFYDPWNIVDTNIYTNTPDASIAFLRHAEIKHGRVAMAAFVGYLVQSNGIRFPWPAQFDGTPFPSADISPPEQWDALPEVAKWQIILFAGFLEVFSEIAGTHYMRGGKPGVFPNFSDFPDKIPHPIPFNLFDPFGFSKKRSEEAKAKGLIAELNNGRLAQIGILGFLAAQEVEGSVPLLKGVVAHYDGQVMAPVSTCSLFCLAFSIHPAMSNHKDSLLAPCLLYYSLILSLVASKVNIGYNFLSN
jgi:hypothetical protein